MPTVNLYEAKTQLSSLVERAAAGEEIVITKNGVARARLIGISVQAAQRRPANALRIREIAAEFDAPDASIARLFAGGRWPAA
jgi:prevent-host-death family protein